MHVLIVWPLLLIPFIVLLFWYGNSEDEGVGQDAESAQPEIVHGCLAAPIDRAMSTR
jgi:hypothetical protein